MSRIRIGAIRFAITLYALKYTRYDSLKMSDWIDNRDGAARTAFCPVVKFVSNGVGQLNQLRFRLTEVVSPGSAAKAGIGPSPPDNVPAREPSARLCPPADSRSLS